MEKTERKTKGNAKLLWHFLQGSRALFVCSILCSALSSLADMLDPQIFRVAIDNVIGGKPSELPAWTDRLIESAGGIVYLRQHLWIMALAVIAVAVLRVAAQYGTTVLNTKASETFIKRSRDELFSHIEMLPYSWHMKNHTGDIIQRCTSDVDRVRIFVSEQLTSVFRITIYLVLAMYFMFSMNVSLALIALIPIPFILIYSVHFRRKMEEGFRECEENEGVVSSIFQ